MAFLASSSTSVTNHLSDCPASKIIWVPSIKSFAGSSPPSQAASAKDLFGLKSLIPGIEIFLSIEPLIGIKLENCISHSSAYLNVFKESEAKLQESPLTSSGKGMAWFVIELKGGARLTPIYPFCRG